MATLPLAETPAVAAEAPAPEAWLFGRRADLGWFGLTALVSLALYLPAYWLFGSKAVWPLYLIYVVGFATPHTWFTYAVTAPPSAHGLYTRRSFTLPLALTLGLVALLPVVQRFGGWDLFFTAITMVGFYHVYKQHVGLLRLYDAKYAAVHGDRTIFAAMQPFHQLAALSFALPILWVWVRPQFEIVVDIQRFVLLHPELPTWVALPYLALMGWYAVQAARALAARHQEGKPLPKGHLMLFSAAMLTYVASFGLVPFKDYLLTVAIFITYHDLQYAGFVWNFQAGRGEVEAPKAPLDRVHRWAHERRYAPYFGVAFLFSVAVIGVISAVPPVVALAVVVFHNNLHYFMDGMIWQRKHNPSLQDHMGITRLQAGPSV